MSKTKYNLLCVAHPDDETIFFGGLLQRLRTHPWRVICITDGNADKMGSARHRQFMRACKLLKVAQAEWWSYKDRYETRLPITEIVNQLASLPRPQKIFTHGILGEYGHPHHQDVSYAVHSAFHDSKELYASAYNSFPTLKINLTAAEFEKKAFILANTYSSETSRFLHLLPATSFEGFLKLDFKEVKAIYEYFTTNKKLPTSALKTYKWLAKSLKANRQYPRPF